MANAEIYIPGSIFNNWLIKKRIDYYKVEAQCKCGVIKIIKTGNIKKSKGGCDSCCIRSPYINNENYGLSKYPIYKIWASFKHRYLNNKLPIDPRWMRFLNFLKDNDLSIDDKIAIKCKDKKLGFVSGNIIVFKIA